MWGACTILEDCSFDHKMPVITSSSSSARSVDTLDHNGIRGVASLWIMFFHIFVYTNYRIDLQGSTLMPLFFSLSGFSMAIGYSGKLWKKDTENTTSTKNPQHGDDPATDVLLPRSDDDIDPIGCRKSTQPTESNSSIRFLLRFYYNRLIRIMPVYYLCFLFALPITFAGYGTMQLSYHLLSSTPSSSTTTLSTLLVNIIPISTWTSFYLGGPIDGPEWTIATLIFFWLCFPFLLKYYEKLSDHDLLTSIIRLYWWNVILGVVFFFIGLFIGGFGLAFWLSTGWPLSRLPVFILGMNAGILCQRYAHIAIAQTQRGEREKKAVEQHDEEETDMANPHPRNNDDDNLTLPWFPPTWTLVPYRYSCLCCCSNTANSVKSISNRVDFTKTIAWRSIQLLTATFLLTFLQAGNIYIVGNIWFQFINVFAQIDILVAFCQYGGYLMATSSIASTGPWTVIAAQRAVRLLRHPWSQWFGELSMSLYMVHWPVIFYACWFHHGSLLHWPATMDCSKDSADDDMYTKCQDEVDAFNHARTPQYWMIPVIAVVAIGLATLLYYCVEVPVRTYFK